MASHCLHWDTPDDLDHRAEADTAARFCDRAARPLGERPEHPPTPRQMAAFIAAADEAGLLPQPELPGVGLWASFDASAVWMSAGILARVAEHSAAAAYHLHQTALGRRLAARLGLDKASPRPCLYGPAGLAKGAAGAVLAQRGGPQGNAPAAAFPDPQACPETALPLVIFAADPWDSIILPVWSASRAQLGWAAADRAALAVTEISRSHGLEGVAAWRLEFPRPPAPIMAIEPLAHYRDLLALDAVGLVATGLGSARAAVAKAYDYAHARRQGGKLIIEHAAVRLLVGGADADATAAEALLRQMCAAPRDLRTVLMLRATAHPLLCRAATAALQVFGGSGYMRDMGLERALRDNNHLRLCAGSPNDLVLTALAMAGAV